MRGLADQYHLGGTEAVEWYAEGLAIEGGQRLHRLAQQAGALVPTQAR